MLTVLISCLIFSCFLLLGNVLMFVTSVVYGLIPFHFTYYHFRTFIERRIVNHWNGRIMGLR